MELYGQELSGFRVIPLPRSPGRTGPLTEGMTDWGRSNPNTLLRVARLVCHSKSRRGRYAVRATSISSIAARDPARASRIAGWFERASSTAPTRCKGLDSTSWAPAPSGIQLRRAVNAMARTVQCASKEKKCNFAGQSTVNCSFSK